MSSKVYTDSLNSVSYDKNKEELTEKSKKLSSAQIQIENSSHAPKNLSDSEEESVDSTDSTFLIELSSDDDTQYTDFISPKKYQSVLKKIKSHVSSFLPTKTMESSFMEKEKTEIDEIEIFKGHIVRSINQSLSDSALNEQILGTKEEPQATQDSWNKDKKETTLYPDPVPPILGEKERPPVIISEQVIKDMERPGFRLEIGGKIYENPVNKKTTQELVQENTNFINQFQIDSKTEENQKKTVTINGKKNEIDSNKLVEFVGKKYTYETARELIEKYGEKAAQLILFGFHQGHWTRDCAFTSAIKVKLLTEYNMNNIKQPLEMRNDRVIKVEVERNLSNKICRFKFKFASSAQFVEENHDKPEIEIILKFQFHVDVSSEQFKVENYSVEKFSVCYPEQYK